MYNTRGEKWEENYTRDDLGRLIADLQVRKADPVPALSTMDSHSLQHSGDRVRLPYLQSAM